MPDEITDEIFDVGDMEEEEEQKPKLPPIMTSIIKSVSFLLVLALGVLLAIGIYTIIFALKPESEVREDTQLGPTKPLETFEIHKKFHLVLDKQFRGDSIYIDVDLSLGYEPNNTELLARLNNERDIIYNLVEELLQKQSYSNISMADKKNSIVKKQIQNHITAYLFAKYSNKLIEFSLAKRNNLKLKKRDEDGNVITDRQGNPVFEYVGIEGFLEKYKSDPQLTKNSIDEIYFIEFLVTRS